MSVVSFLTNHLTAPSDVESIEESHVLTGCLIQENTTKEGLRNLDNYSVGYYGVTGDRKEYFDVFETSYTHWRNWHWFVPILPNVVILLRSCPDNLEGPEFAGYLLSEWEDPDYPGLVGLVMVPRPQQAHMSLEQFWAVEVSSERLSHEPDAIGTRHGIYNLDIKGTANWVMSVDPDDVEDIESPEEPDDTQLRRYQREPCRRVNENQTDAHHPHPHRRPRYR
ncbi:hypothetical protein F5Y06DRAFT_11270 [Hypoxylon sp. FL0890]|nr:hypothetical protein F5Y06DRAFT_11270 [Hypoxylon sp. FL0890]